MDNSLKAAITAMESGIKPTITLKPEQGFLPLITTAQWFAIHEAASILKDAGLLVIVQDWITMSPEAIEAIKNS